MLGIKLIHVSKRGPLAFTQTHKDCVSSCNKEFEITVGSSYDFVQTVKIIQTIYTEFGMGGGGGVCVCHVMFGQVSNHIQCRNSKISDMG